MVTFLLNLISLFTILGFLTVLLICMYLFDYLKYKAFRKNKGINKYLRRR